MLITIPGAAVLALRVIVLIKAAAIHQHKAYD
jgi:hypothetical protein